MTVISRARVILVTVLAASLATSCATAHLWRSTNPDAEVLVPESEVSETELQQKGVPYVKDQRGMYHIGKTGMERFENHAVRFMLTPATVVLDVAPVFALISAEVFLNNLALRSGGHTNRAQLEP
jgi:hypothetical protein